MHCRPTSSVRRSGGFTSQFGARTTAVEEVDLRRAEGQAFRSLLGLLQGGELFVRARGKELVIAVGQVRLASIVAMCTHSNHGILCPSSLSGLTLRLKASRRSSTRQISGKWCLKTVQDGTKMARRAK